MVAYVAARQMAKVGDLWPYSTRATEARGGRYKRLKKITCQRKRCTGYTHRGFLKGKLLGAVEFKKQRYNSSTSFQLLRGACAQEANAHRLSGRSRLRTTGRKTLKRTVPKWQEDAFPMPPMGRLLDASAVREMFSKAANFFAKSNAFPCPLPLRALRLAAGS